MHRHIVSALVLCSLLLCHGAAPAFASEADVTTVLSDSGYSDVIHIGGETETFSRQYPVSMDMQTIGGVPYIIKVYDVPADYAVEQLVSEFEQDGYAFCRSDILVKELEGSTDTQTVSKAVTAAAQTNEKDKLLATVEQTLDYSQDGYTGQL